MHAVKAYGAEEVQLHAFLSSALDGVNAANNFK